MLLLNFSHPLSPAQVQEIKNLTNSEVTVRDIQVHIDNTLPLLPQIKDLVIRCSLAPDEWQNLTLLVNLPGYTPIAAMLLAELHGRMGHFPSVLRIRPVDGSTPVQYEVAEIINLQGVRDNARQERYGSGQ